jgi:hypothetical protein
VTDRADPWWVTDRAAQFRAFADTDGRTAPLYARLAGGAADDPEVLALLDPAPARQQRTVLLLASVHHLVLSEPGAELARWYPSVDPAEAERRRVAGMDPYPAFRRFCLEHRAAIEERVATRTTQTNEVGRCLALLPALQVVHRRTSRPLALLEVGCSAGLNLRLDRYRFGYGDPVRWVGDPAAVVQLRAREVGDVPVPGPGAVPPIAGRVGLDRSPVDVHAAEEVRWLEACVFPDRLDRIERLRRAVEVARTEPVRTVAGDGAADLAWVAATLPADATLCVFHSWALTYFDDRDGFAAAVGGLAAGGRDVWWISVEPSGAVPGLAVPPRDQRLTPEMAANTVVALMHATPDGRHDLVLARCHPHLDWIQWLEAIPKDRATGNR